MQRDPEKLIEDIVVNGADCLEFLEGKTEADYVQDKALRAMVERKLFIVGEALVQLKALDPTRASAISDLREIVGFRNLLAHAYFALDHRRVFDIAKLSLPTVIKQVQQMTN